MGDDAERAEDDWWALPANERYRIEREIELGEIDGEPDPWRVDEDNAERYGSALGPTGLREQLAGRSLRGYPPRPPDTHVIEIDERPSLPPRLREIVARLAREGRARPAFDEELARAVIEDADDSRGGPHRGRRTQELIARRATQATQAARISDLSTAGRKSNIRTVFADQTGGLSMDKSVEMINSLPPAVQLKLAELRPAEIGAVLDVLATMQAEPVSGRWPAEPPVGSVLRFEHAFRGGIERYTYVALRTGVVDRPWFITSSRGRERMEWDALCTMIGDEARAEVATGWFEIPAFTVPEQTDGDVGAFVALFGERGKDVEVSAAE